MKKLLIGLFGLIVGACQHSAPPAVKATVTKLFTNSVAPGSQPIRQSIITTDSLTPEMMVMLRRFDFAPLWSGQQSETAVPVIDGFFGSEHRRISFVFTEIRRDSQKADLFHVRGKNKFQRVITPFTGTVQIVSLSNLPKHGFLDMDSASSQAYTAKAAFAFLEKSGAANAGKFTGTAFLDFFINGSGDLQIAQTVETPDTTAPARGAGVVYRGKWTAYASQLSKPVTLSNNVFLIAPEMLPHFGIGERSGQINPKYAKLGWNDLMENDEWWADSPNPLHNL